MNSFVCSGIAALLTFAVGMVFADQHESGEGSMDPAIPAELYVCSFNEGHGPDSLDKVVASWNRWADDNDLTDYSAWTLTPFYFGPEQDFDFIWLGASPTAEGMGRAQDRWLSAGGAVAAEFAEISTCNAHGNMATLQFKDPPERDNPGSVVLAFSDCSMHDGVTFDDVAPAIGEWSAYRSEHGSTSGMWVMFPAYGGGGEEFDFKFVAGWQNLAEQGADWDQYSREGWRKAEELFADKLSCDSSRVYVATTRRSMQMEE